MPSTLQSISHGDPAGTGKPTIAAGAGAGTTPTITLAGGAGDQVGVANITTGTTPAAGILATVTFGKAYKTAPKVVQVTRVDGVSAAGLVVVAGTIATNSFNIVACGTPGTATAYQVAYMVAPEDGEV